MIFEEVVKKRQSTRSYLPKKVPVGLIAKMLEMANLAPSAGNLQARKVVIVRDEEVIKKIKEVTSGLGRFSDNIPLIFVVCAVPEVSAVRYEERGRNLYALQDATIFASYLQLAAVSLDLASCWVGSFKERRVSEICNLPENLIPVAMIPVGFSNEEPREKHRKSLAELILKRI
ncbi:nitroreductase family protein [Patescibacteria group bacterium]|nr:nitroreductase family protein [Patescibacteria group bacterium]